MSSPGLRVAIVEPLPSLADRFAVLLRHRGHDIVTADDNPDAVVVSARGWAGAWETVLAEQTDSTAPIVLTDVRVRRDTAIPEGVGALLARPFRGDDLHAAVVHAARRKPPTRFGSLGPIPSTAGGEATIVVDELLTLGGAEAAAEPVESPAAPAPVAAAPPAAAHPVEVEEPVLPATAAPVDNAQEPPSVPAAPSPAPASPPPEVGVSAPDPSVEEDLDALAALLADRVDEWSALPEGEMRTRVVRAFLAKWMG